MHEVSIVLVSIVLVNIILVNHSVLVKYLVISNYFNANCTELVKLYQMKLIIWCHIKDM